MQFRIEFVAISDGGTECRQELMTLTRTTDTTETIGLSLTEGKWALQRLQQALVQCQVNTYLEKQRPCSHCGRRRQLKQGATAPFRTPFGRVEVNNPHWWQCDCCTPPTKTIRPLTQLLPERTSPELLYLETKWAALMPYGMTTQLLSDVLPRRCAITLCGRPSVWKGCSAMNKKTFTRIWLGRSCRTDPWLSG